MSAHLYLDIDGVLNPWNVDDTWGAVVTEDILTSYYPALVIEMNRLFQDFPDLKVFWLTSWEDSAAGFGTSAGLTGSDAWPWLQASGGGRGDEWEKFVSIQSHVAEHRPDKVVWCDDELFSERPCMQWTVDQGYLGVSPTDILTPDHLQEIRAYLNG